MKEPCDGTRSPGNPLPTRMQAEKKLFHLDTLQLKEMGQEEIRQAIYEVHVLQKELEKRNEELLQSQEECYEMWKRYLDLYHYAPVACLSLNNEGLILKANFMAAAMLGTSRDTLIGQPLSRYVVPVDLDIYYHQCKQLSLLYSAESGNAPDPRLCELRMAKKDDGTVFWVNMEAAVRKSIDNTFVFRVILCNISRLKNDQASLYKAFENKIRTLCGVIPICANCKKIRDGQGHWNEVETYIQKNSSAKFSHGICPDCFEKLYPDI